MLTKLTKQEEEIATRLYNQLNGLSIARSKAVVNEVMRMLKDLSAMLEEKTSVKEAESV